MFRGGISVRQEAFFVFPPYRTLRRSYFAPSTNTIPASQPTGHVQPRSAHRNIDTPRVNLPGNGRSTGCSLPQAGKLSFTRLRRAGSSYRVNFREIATITLYVLRGLRNRKRYVGITNDLARRVAEHRRNTSKGSQVIGEFIVVLTEEHPTYLAAREREKFPKSGQDRQWLDLTLGK